MYEWLVAQTAIAIFVFLVGAGFLGYNGQLKPSFTKILLQSRIGLVLLPFGQWMKRLRQSLYPDDAAVDVLGGRSTLIIQPKFIQAIFADFRDCLTTKALHCQVLSRVFGADLNTVRSVEEPLLRKAFKIRADHRAAIRIAFVKQIKTHATDITTLNERLVDQNSWERTAEVVVKILPSQTSQERELVAEVNLFALLTSFLGSLIADSLIGEFILDDEDFFSKNIWELERGCKWLMLQTPRWIPIPSLLRALIAQKNLLHHLKYNCTRVQKGLGQQEDGDASDEFDGFGDVFCARIEDAKASGLPDKIVSSIEMSLVWNLVAQTSVSAFWLLLHIYQSPTLPSAIRKEIGSQVQILQPTSNFKLPEPRRLTFVKNGEDISSTCPVLKATYMDIRRLYCINPVAARVDRTFSVKKDPATDSLTPVITEVAPDKTLPTISSATSTYTFKADTYIIGIDNANIFLTDHSNSPSFSAATSTHIPENPANSSQAGSDDLINDFSLLPKSLLDLIEDLTLTIVAAILTLWDVEAIGSNDDNDGRQDTDESNPNNEPSTLPHALPSSLAAEIQKSTSPTSSSRPTDPKSKESTRHTNNPDTKPKTRNFQIPAPQWNSLLATPKRDIRIVIRPTTD